MRREHRGACWGGSDRTGVGCPRLRAQGRGADVRKAVVVALDSVRDGPPCARSCWPSPTTTRRCGCWPPRPSERAGAAEAADALIPLLDRRGPLGPRRCPRSLESWAPTGSARLLAGHLTAASDIFLLALDGRGRQKRQSAMRCSPPLPGGTTGTPRSARPCLGRPGLLRLGQRAAGGPVPPFRSPLSVRKSAADIPEAPEGPRHRPAPRRMAAQDPDATVRQAARDALGDKYWFIRNKADEASLFTSLSRKAAKDTKEKRKPERVKRTVLNLNYAFLCELGVFARKSRY